ncbi:carbon-nitrogen family hydrolase [Geodermatophilus sp. CPCC 205761]|uniref:carbon-nitrogen family hydrolase n=1 Tax=Geodermatophilus sp. CPCC 205761 TaxID=2936597 RepID=UPI003EEC716C
MHETWLEALAGGGAARRLRLRVVQVAYGDEETPEQRVQRVAGLVAQQRDADLVVLPELWAHGGFASDRWTQRAEPLDGPFVGIMREAARAAGATVHAGSFIERGAGGMWNTSVVVGPAGAVLGTYRKIHRFGEGERSLLEAGTQIVTVPLRLAGRQVATAGLATCYDLRFPELFRRLVDRSCEVLLIPAAWPAARVQHWQVLGQARAIENQCVVVQVNTAGTHSGVAMGGRSQVVGPTGDVLARAMDDGDEVLSVELDLDAVSRQRADFRVLDDRRLGRGQYA